ncbi:hypothetical protein [Streptomyces sudanensis]|nr:hypothetical protein [Streptomyces sudanensis]MCP9956622.1 hypothetical protein [Streptomyces sudanensis]MCP9985826.1 hypothetical protein [Streptomyces sudanensis]MCQ0002774.1 hypothetical protein [Streptomyces sudanensis]
MRTYVDPGQSLASPVWGLTVAMIAASGYRPWVWVALVLAAVLSSRTH